MRRLITSVILYSILVSQSFADQNILSKSNTKYSVNSSSEFIFESYPNQELIPIRLIGAIKNAGLYHIPPNMKLTTLLALAGGTTSEADLENIIIGNDQQTITNKEGIEKRNLIINLEENLKNARNDYTLTQNDIVLIRNKTPWISNDSFRIFSLISVVLTSILTAIVIKDRYKK
ncbi:MAG: SLBB domain-containing protein [Bacteriovorax sp.]|nr:SLBB domain-containing protein [Bacteriovorax sp.]